MYKLKSIPSKYIISGKIVAEAKAFVKFLLHDANFRCVTSVHMKGDRFKFFSLIRTI